MYDCHAMTPAHPARLEPWIRSLQAQGRLTFTLDEVDRALGGTRVAHQSAIRRLKERGLLASPRRGFYVVVPPEYDELGAPPASWFVDDLMGVVGRPYYVALLSAAALHGAAHHQPQAFQVMTDGVLAPTSAGRVHLVFFRKRHLEATPTVRMNTPTGTMCVATPEATVFDLVRHVGACGGIDNVATVLAELADALDPQALGDAAALAHLTEVQRAGYLLEQVDRPDRADVLAQQLEGRRVPATALRPDAPIDGAPRVDRWRLLVNAVVEPDL